tara:strand:+ start:3485 stop:5482 length:1998 start_codon:yes stop_codon:yes gene_type:complete
MSYIIKSTSPFASTKLTETGREKIARGQLNFTSWSIGDSEINYVREGEIQDAVITGTTSKILRPKDKQPNLKYFISNSSGSQAFNFGGGDIRCIKATVNNEATERGFFSGTSLNNYIADTSLYVRTSGTSVTIGGGTSLTLAGVEIGDFLLVKIGYSDFTNETPEGHLWFKAQNVVGSTVTVDRALPSVGGGNAVVVYKGGELYDIEDPQIAYWDTGTLSFDASGCTTTMIDVPIWNMNIPFSENILGTSGTTLTGAELHNRYGSYDLIGEKDNYLYSSTAPFLKSTAIIHYSNKTISNLYGEFLHIDGATKSVKLHLPTLMYHRRDVFSGVSGGTEMGMTFIASGTSLSVGSNGLTYVELMEDSLFVTGSTPQTIGRVYPSLKIMVIDNPEVVAAISYKSNRNWTLPALNLALTNPSGGVGTGLLPVNSTMHVTYAIDNESGTGIAPALPCQNFASISNTSTSSKDVSFNVENVDLLPYMRSDETNGGFYGDTFKVMYQITTDGDRPVSESWKVLDFSSSLSGTYIDPTELENPNPLSFTPNFQLTQTLDGTATIYSVVSTLTMPDINSPETLQFGDEKFFYGNIETFIGATIFKTIFKISINASDFSSTTNLTRTSSVNPPNLRVSEVGVYDSDGDLVIISKLSVPVELTPGKTVILELSMDF